MIEVGKRQRLTVLKKVDFGVYLDAGELGEVLLPKRFLPKSSDVGESIEVFLYHDSEDRLIATSEQAYVSVGSFACLKVVQVNQIGAFLDWGLMKDLMVPFSEQKPKMEEGKRYVVGVYLDEHTGRITASARLNDFLYDENKGHFKLHQKVSLFTADKTDLGYKMIVDDSHWGLLHQHDVLRELKRGERLEGFIKNIRQDQRLDLCLYIQPSEKTSDVSDDILDALAQHQGFLSLNDKSSPAAIKAMFGVSKGQYKKALGALYRQKKIRLEKDGVYLQ